jgi:antitoxin (DNA-binding transcriptional repressor) of toxin-antitoxin stability system
VQTITIPIGAEPSDLGHLVDQVQSGIQVILTSHGQPKAVLSAYRSAGKPWRVATPDDPKLHGDLQSPVLEDWQ